MTMSVTPETELEEAQKQIEKYEKALETIGHGIGPTQYIARISLEHKKINWGNHDVL
jgi:hypothetical protein